MPVPAPLQRRNEKSSSWKRKCTGESRLPSHAETGKGSLAIVGLGPGRMEYITPRALKAIARAEYVLGHSTYLVPLEPLLAGKTVI
ncbi:MAG: SAM-dependent methyltransferase, partial [Methanoregula sp.]